jgi:hypothetical protein
MFLKSEEIDKILPAIFDVKIKLQAVTKGSNNPFFKSKYADLNTHLEEVEPLLHDNGLVLMQPPSIGENSNTVSTIIFHRDSGQYIGGNMKLVGETDMQKAGSAITYARRYILSGLLSIKTIDDDGNTASGKAKPKSNSSYTPKKTASPASRPSFSKSAAKSVQTNFEDEDGL